MMKDDLAGGRLPSGLFGANAAWWAIMVLAHNLNALMKGHPRTHRYAARIIGSACFFRPIFCAFAPFPLGMHHAGSFAAGRCTRLFRRQWPRKSEKWPLVSKPAAYQLLPSFPSRFGLIAGFPPAFAGDSGTSRSATSFCPKLKLARRNRRAADRRAFCIKHEEHHRRRRGALHRDGALRHRPASRPNRDRQGRGLGRRRAASRPEEHLSQDRFSSPPDNYKRLRQRLIMARLIPFYSNSERTSLPATRGSVPMTRWKRPASPSRSSMSSTSTRANRSMTPRKGGRPRMLAARNSIRKPRCGGPQDACYAFMVELMSRISRRPPWV